MSWTAPEVTRAQEPLVGDERTILLGWLEYHRATLLVKCAGLTGEQLARRSVPPSTLSLLGLVRHMTDVERSWFLRRIGGQSVDLHYDTPEDPDFDINGASAETAEADYALLIEEIDRVRAAFEGVSLEFEFEHPRRGTMSARWVLTHMIEEYARHNGHADFLRETIDGTTGD